MNEQEWDALCNGCAKCCLHKLQDEATGEVVYTDALCRLLNLHMCRCEDYTHRHRRVDECCELSVQGVKSFQWLPATCAYWLVASGQELTHWHPLQFCDPESVHRAGILVRHRVVSLSYAHETGNTLYQLA